MTPGTCPGTLHGTYYAYNKHGCRCDDARALASRRTKQWRIMRQRGIQNRYPTEVVQRRLKALARMGYSRDTLRKMGCPQPARPSPEYVNRNTYVEIRRFYEEFSHITGPDPKAASYALTRGWHPPASWDDIDNLDETPVRLPAIPSFEQRKRARDKAYRDRAKRQKVAA